jgi:hypothetical protein
VKTTASLRSVSTTRPPRARCDCITLAIGRRYERTKKPQHFEAGNEAAAKSKVQNEPLISTKPTTAQKLAKQPSAERAKGSK